MANTENPAYDKEREINPEKSITSTFVPIISVINESEKILGENRIWRPGNTTQLSFVDQYLSRNEEVKQLASKDSDDSPLSIDSIASYSHAEIKQFLDNHGIDLNPSDFSEPDFGIASVMEVLVKWRRLGWNTNIEARNGKKYEGVRIDGIPVYEYLGYSNPVISIPTASEGYKVNFTIPDWNVVDSFGLADYIEGVMEIKNLEGQEAISWKKFSYDYRGVIFPKVDLDQEVDISWLKGLLTQVKLGRRAEVSEALQRTIFKLNEKGAYAKSGVAVNVEVMSAMPQEPAPYVINRPFVTWIEAPGTTLPLFAGYIDYCDWKNPGELPL